MPNLNAPASKRFNGWYRDSANDLLEFYHKGTKTGHANSTSLSLVGNLKLGTPPDFATTQPVGAVIMGGTTAPTTGIAPVGAIVTAGAVFASDTVVRKIIADGTASNVET